MTFARLTGLAALALLGLAPLLVTSASWLSFWIGALLFALLGQAWNVLGGYGGQNSFGHAVFFGTGAYGAAILQVKFGVPAPPAALAGIALGALVGLLIGALSFRSGLRGSYFALATLAFAEIFRITAGAVAITGGGQGILIPLDARAANLQFVDRRAVYYLLLALVLGTLALTRALERSRFGARLMAVRENEDAARALGINAFRVKLGAITLSGAITAAAGVVYVQYFLFVDAHLAYGPSVSIEALLGPLIGGVGTAAGPIVGAIVLHAVGEGAKRVMGDTPGLDLALYGFLLIAMLRFLPDGLIGLARRVARRRPAAVTA